MAPVALARARPPLSRPARRGGVHPGRGAAHPEQSRLEPPARGAAEAPVLAAGRRLARRAMRTGAASAPPVQASAGGGRLARWREAKRILVIRLDKLGDVLMTTPAIAAVRETVPGASITLLTSACGAKLAPHLPFIDECIAFEAPWVGHGSGADDADAAGTSTAAESRLLQRLSDGRFDAAIVFTSCNQSALPAALLCRQAGIPLRLAHSRENPYRLLSDWLADPDVIGDGMRHEVERQLALVG